MWSPGAPWASIQWEIPPLNVLSSTLQAGILIVVQAVTLMTLFPALLKLDARRRARHRMDVLCCLRQSLPAPVALPEGASHPQQQHPVRFVETTSTKVHLGGNAVATVRVSVSTHSSNQDQPRLLQNGPNVSSGLLVLLFLCIIPA